MRRPIAALLSSLVILIGQSAGATDCYVYNKFEALCQFTFEGCSHHTAFSRDLAYVNAGGDQSTDEAAPHSAQNEFVAAIVKPHAQRAGLDPKQFAGHSLRSGFLTSAAARGASIFKMADQSRHKNMDTLRGYVRDAEIFEDHAGTVIAALHNRLGETLSSRGIYLQVGPFKIGIRP